MDRPVSSGRASFEALLARFERVSVEHREQLGVIVAQAGDLVATVGDADAAAYEVAEAHRAAEIRIAQAHTAQDSAEKAAIAARRDTATAIEAQAQADAAAEDALAQLDAVRAQSAEQLAQYQATTEAALAERWAARAELEEVRATAATAVTDAQDAAERQVRETIGERDRALAEREADAQERLTAMRNEIDAAQAHAEQQVRTLRGDLADATSAATRAHAEHAAAERAAAEDRATLTRLRSELDDARRQHHEELTTLRHEARTDRELLRADHAEQLHDIRQATEDRVRALTRALELAQTAADTYRAQLTNHATTAASDPLQDTPPVADTSTTRQTSGETRRRP